MSGEAVRVPVVETVVVRVATGQPGSPGSSAYDVAVANGFVGSEAEWLETLQGGPGEPGVPGATATITVGTVTTGAPGSDAEVENVGTSSAAILNFTIPEGQPGEDATGGGGAWGSITGTLSDQTDLQAELDGKSDVGHTHSADDISDGATNHVFTAADDTKLAGIEAGATANSSDATLLARANHTGTQTASTISDFNTAADARVAAGITGKLDTSAAPELIRDTMGSALVAGANITVTVNDAGDTITIADTVSPISAGSANNPHTTKGAARNSALPKNFWQYTGTAGVDDPTNWVDGDEWISA